MNDPQTSAIVPAFAVCISLKSRLIFSLPFMRKVFDWNDTLYIGIMIRLLLNGNGNYCVYTGRTCLRFHRALRWLGASADAIWAVIDTQRD